MCNKNINTYLCLIKEYNTSCTAISCIYDLNIGVITVLSCSTCT
jgi:hypothetical protein